MAFKIQNCRVVLLFLILAFTVSVQSVNNPFDLSVRKTPRLHIPFLGIGAKCNGCPPVSCEDDRAVIYGYCCGCAKLFDKLPVLCPHGLQCPLNGAGLCHDYEYMLQCCC